MKTHLLFFSCFISTLIWARPVSNLIKVEPTNDQDLSLIEDLAPSELTLFEEKREEDEVLENENTGSHLEEVFSLEKNLVIEEEVFFNRSKIIQEDFDVSENSSEPNSDSIEEVDEVSSKTEAGTPEISFDF